VEANASKIPSSSSSKAWAKALAKKAVELMVIPIIAGTTPSPMDTISNNTIIKLGTALINVKTAASTGGRNLTGVMFLAIKTAKKTPNIALYTVASTAIATVSKKTGKTRSASLKSITMSGLIASMILAIREIIVRQLYGIK
jgi:hypothetical protein